MSQDSSAVNSARRLDERTARIVCRRAGLAVRHATYREAAEALFMIALDLAVCSPQGLDELLDGFADSITHLQRTRRRGLLYALKAAEPPTGSAEWLARQMRDAA